MIIMYMVVDCDDHVSSGIFVKIDRNILFWWLLLMNSLQGLLLLRSFIL